MKPKADIRIFIGYAPAKKAYRIYNKRFCLIIETIHVDFDELTKIASKQFSLGPGPQLLTLETISSRLVPNPPFPTPHVPPTKRDWDILFQPMFDEYFNPPPSVASLVPTVVAPEPADSTGKPSSTTNDQDAPSLTLFCYFDAFLASVEPKNYKETLKKAGWIEAMQKELNEFERLEVWELVPRPDCVIIITLKWIFKVKLDELGGVLKNKASSPKVEKSKLDAGPQGKEVDPTCCRGMIGSLMYLISSRPNLVFAVCMCTQYQAKPTEKHLHAVKRVFRYLRGTINMGLWYSKDSCIALTTFVDADHVGCQDTRRSTSGRMQLLGDKLVSWLSKKQNSTAISSTEAEYIALSRYCACNTPKNITTQRNTTWDATS
ncbi:retrovirus-related pol polyprotein from transposon TNT 1-94 [Tanacetum coccineum]